MQRGKRTSALKVSRGDKASFFPHPLTPPWLSALACPHLSHLQFVQYLVRIWMKTTVKKEYCADSQTGLNILRDSLWKGLCSTPLIKIKKGISLSDVSKFFRIDITEHNCIWCFHSSSFKWHSYLNMPIQSACWNLSRAAFTHLCTENTLSIKWI